MRRKIPPDAFSYYVSLGVNRSYLAVAKHYGASKASVTKLASKESWQRRVGEIEARARAASDERAVETLEAINGRHLKAMRIVQAKALETLKTMTLSDAMDAVRALDMAVRQERLILGEPTDRSAVNVEEIIKREYERWMIPAEAKPTETPVEVNGRGNGTG
jgi:hypothetical protein